MSDENWFSLARDTDTGRVFVLHEWSHRKGQAYKGGNQEVELGEFLRASGTAQAKLLALIGLLATDNA